MYRYTGNGGHFFEDLYCYISVSDIRKEPASKEEFCEYGLSEEVFNTYLSHIRRLYGECFIYSNALDIKNKQGWQQIEHLWNQLTDFCIQNRLILEYADESGRRMPVKSPGELFYFPFICRFPELPEAIYVYTVDEFRLVVETALASLAYDWYLNAKYEVYVRVHDGHEMIMCADRDNRCFAPVARQKVQCLLDEIQRDVEAIKEKIAELSSNHPCSLSDVKTPGESNEIYDAQCKWVKQLVCLYDEYNLLDECLEMVSGIVQSGVHNDIYDTFPDETLYVHKGPIVCLQQHHNIEQATAVLTDRNGEDIELNVNHCIDCNKFFVDYKIYKIYRENYGAILGDICLTKNGEFEWDESDLSEESPLHLCGYNANQKSNLSQADRQTIIESCIKNGVMTKASVINLLSFFVDMHGAKKGNELAVKKWRQDLEFVLAYGTSRQEHFRITKIEQYKRNRYYIQTCSKQPLNSGTTSDETISYLGKRVVHKLTEFGAGTVKTVTDNIIEVVFDNGKKGIFTCEKFENFFSAMD